MSPASKLAASIGLEKTTSTPWVNAERLGLGTMPGTSRTVSATIARFSQSTDRESIPALPARSVTPSARAVRR